VYHTFQELYELKATSTVLISAICHKIFLYKDRSILADQKDKVNSRNQDSRCTLIQQKSVQMQFKFVR